MAASRTSSRLAAAVDLEVVVAMMRGMLVMTHKLVNPAEAKTRVRPCP
jgi:hypothetical protein